MTNEETAKMFRTSNVYLYKCVQIIIVDNMPDCVLFKWIYN